MRHHTHTILAAWPSLRWRHHGAGLLQAYLPTHADTPQRLHIWHPSLLKPGIVEGGAKHNHRFHLRSTILHGRLLHTVLRPEPDECGDHRLWRIEGASNRAQARLVPEGRVRLHESWTTVYGAGHTYALLKWDYHWARPCMDPSDVTITLVDMVEKEGGPGAPRKGDGKWARLVCPVDVEPVHAFEESEDTSQHEGLVDRARGVLEWSRSYLKPTE